MIDYNHLSKCLKSSGTVNFSFIEKNFSATPGWGELAAEVLRLSALVQSLTHTCVELSADRKALVAMVQTYRHGTYLARNALADINIPAALDRAGSIK